MELNEKVGEYIAQITGAEAGLVVSGAAGGVVLSMAACMTGKNVGFVRQLPNTTGMKNELAIQKIHRGGYSDMYTFAGAKFNEAGSVNGCLAEELDLDPDNWRDLKGVLPLLSQKKYYKDLKYGYARGSEPVIYVQRVRNYQNILRAQLAKKRGAHAG